MKDSISVNDTMGKVIFWDIDGTLSPYRWNGVVSGVPGYGEEICPAVESGLFLKREPSKHMQRVVKCCDASMQFVLGHYTYEKEKQDKVEWSHRYFPLIDDSIFVYINESKADALLDFCKAIGVSTKDVIFVDDRIDILAEAESKGIECWHISSFLDWFEE